MHDNALTFPLILLFGALFGILLHALFLGRYVARRESATSEHTARLVIFFSGLWFIGLITYGDRTLVGAYHALAVRLGRPNRTQVIAFCCCVGIVVCDRRLRVCSGA